MNPRWPQRHTFRITELGIVPGDDRVEAVVEIVEGDLRTDGAVELEIHTRAADPLDLAGQDPLGTESPLSSSR